MNDVWICTYGGGWAAPDRGEYEPCSDGLEGECFCGSLPEEEALARFPELKDDIIAAANEPEWVGT